MSRPLPCGYPALPSDPPKPGLRGARPLRQKSLTEQLIARLSGDISTGRLRPNERLPTEQELIARFGVSRTVVREAISALRSQGLVDSRQGAGVFVTADPTQRPFRLDPDGLDTAEGVLDVMELRMAVEIEAAGLAAERHSAADVRTMEKTLSAFEEAIDTGGEAIDADYQFHLAICRATGNDYFRSLVEMFGQQIIPRRSIHLEPGDTSERRAYLRRVSGEHRAILNAIRSGNAGSARSAMRRHLRRGRNRYLKVLQQDRRR